MEPLELPDGVELTRITPEFDENTVPAGLLAAHRVADGVWGRLVVRRGSVGFAFEDADADGQGPRLVPAGEDQLIPPRRLHHLELQGPVTFVVEFYK